MNSYYIFLCVFVYMFLNAVVDGRCVYIHVKSWEIGELGKGGSW